MGFPRMFLLLLFVVWCLAESTPSEINDTTVHILMPVYRPRTLEHTIGALTRLTDHSFGTLEFHFGVNWHDSITQRSVDAAIANRGIWRGSSSIVHRVFDRRGDVSSIVSSMFGVSDMRSRYFLRFNDDSRMQTPKWNRRLIEAIRQEPRDWGIVFIIDTNNVRIQTHSFVSYRHREVFHSYFPVHFHNWYEDDWISSVYPPTWQKVSHVRIRHVSVPERYNASIVPKDVLDAIVLESRAQLSLHTIECCNMTVPSYSI